MIAREQALSWVLEERFQNRIFMKKIFGFVKAKFFLATISLCLISFGFLKFREYQKTKIVSDQIRAKFSEKLKKLPPINYERALGYKPTIKEVELGRLLFNDPILSRNNDVSCATCHLTNHGFADGMPLSIGASGEGGPTIKNVGKHFAEGKLGNNRRCADDGLGFTCEKLMFRNVPSTVNVAYRTDPNEDSGLLLDGRFGVMNFQALLPIHTGEELCGFNPVPADEKLNPFVKGGPIFKNPVLIQHSNDYDPTTGENRSFFNAPAQYVEGIPSRRPNGSVSIPTRNECLAIAVAKVSSIKDYRKRFEEISPGKGVTDLGIGRALAAYLATQVSKNTPYDKFVEGKNSLSEKQLKGMGIFLTSAGQTFDLNGQTLKGAGCAGCHSPPTFGGSGFAALGVKSDPRSSLSRPRLVFSDNGFFTVFREQRGRVPSCHKEETISGTYAPDVGRAQATSDTTDCFKFRISPLRNVIETFPYFHHGTARAQGSNETDYKKRSRLGLRQVIEYHLEGSPDLNMVNRLDSTKKYFDTLYQRDSLVPPEYLAFSSKADIFPLQLSEEEIDSLVEFVATGIYDEGSVVKGDLGNDVGHPSKVPSGFESISRDNGTQLELPPNRDKFSPPKKELNGFAAQ
jgi:cytochrome c peroxidase